MSEHAEVDLLSNGLTELDLGTDEVFIISSVPGPSSRMPFSAHTVRSEARQVTQARTHSGAKAVEGTQARTHGGAFLKGDTQAVACNPG